MTQLSITPETKHASCDNCEWRGSTDDLDMITDAEQRLEPGYITPAGQCPECGALAYLTDKTAPKHSPQFRLYMLEKEQQQKKADAATGFIALNESLQHMAAEKIHLTGSKFGKTLATAWFYGGKKQRARLAEAFPDVFNDAAKQIAAWDAAQQAKKIEAAA